MQTTLVIFRGTLFRSRLDCRTAITVAQTGTEHQNVDDASSIENISIGVADIFTGDYHIKNIQHY